MQKADARSLLPGEPVSWLGILVCRWCGRAMRRCSRCANAPIVSGMSRSRSAPPRSGCGSGWNRSSRPPCLDPEKIFFRWEELQSRSASSRPELLLRELEIVRPRWLRTALHISTRPSMAFHGNMQVAMAEARTLVERGARVAFFAPSTGEVERLADILHEYSVPFQLGLEQSNPRPQYLAERAYMAGAVASIIWSRASPPRHVSPMRNLAIFGSEDLFDTSDLVARARRSQVAAGSVLRPTSSI